MRPKIKICGLTRECDIDYINEAQPEYIGFVFAKSRRQISEEYASALKARTRKEINVVGVFVDAPQEQIIRLMENKIIDIAQFHGSESPSYMEGVKKRVDGYLIKAVRMGEDGYSTSFFEDYKEAGADYFLFDSASANHPTNYGGTGITFDWSKIPAVPLPFFLAGGLHADNAEAAASIVKPYAIDLSSGVEVNGVKDKDKILEIIRRVRNV